MSIAQLHTHTRPQTNTEQYFRLLYGQHMREIPRQRIRNKKHVLFSYDKERSWVFVGSKWNMKPASTFYTFFSMLYDESFDTTFYTPNGFYRNDGRKVDNMRWINALAIDIDPKPYQVLTTQDILDRAENVGLPAPTLIVSTPSAGFHCTWAFDHSIQPIRATRKTIRLFEAIQRHIAEDMGADLFAVGVERIFRTPTEQNICFFQPVSYDFQRFIDWRNEHHPFVPTYVRPSFDTYNLMDEPAIRQLYNQNAEIGKRDASCFTLALAMKFSGFSVKSAMEAIESWWNDCCEKGAAAGKKAFTLRDAFDKVKYVYKAQFHGPSVEDVEALTGMSFSYRYARYRFFTPKKPREERKRVHNYEWKADLIDILKRQKSLEGTMAGIATCLGCAVSTLKVVLNELKKEGVIGVQTKRGRNGITSVQLLEDLQETDASAHSAKNEIAEYTAVEKNSQSNNTGGEEVGGAIPNALSVGSAQDLISMLRLLNAPYATSLPEYLHALYTDKIAIWDEVALFDYELANSAAVHTFAILRKTLMACLRSTKKATVKNLTAYVKHAMNAALLKLDEEGYAVDSLPLSIRNQLNKEKNK